MSKNTIIDGIAASEHLDSSGESLSIKGMDISSLGGPDSILNWEHGSKDRPNQVVGKVTFAKKIMKEEDAKSKREKHYWNKIKKPFVYIKAELFDGLGHSGAQDVAAMLKYKNKDKGEDSRLVVGFSIEGGKIEKSGMVVTKSIARDVAITVKPCNKVCDAEVIQGEISEDFLYKNQGYDCEIVNQDSLINPNSYRLMILQDVKKSEWEPSKEEKKQVKELKIPPKVEKLIEKYDTENNMRKTLIAGMMVGSPDSRTGTAALTPEHLEGKLEKPFRSESQRRFAHANPEKFGGKKGVKEWESKTPKDIPEKVKKSEKLEKARPMMANKELGLGQDVRSDVKFVDPEKTYKSPQSTPEQPKPDVTSGELENKKLVQMAQQGMKQFVKNPQKISARKQKQIQSEAKGAYGDILTPKEHGGTNVNITGGQQRSYSFEKDKPQAPGLKSVYFKDRYKRPSSQQLGAEVHEATHGFFTGIENKYGKPQAQAVSKKMLKDYFHPEDVKNIREFIKSRGYKPSSSHFNEEHITHISDILNTPKTRMDFYKHLGFEKPQELLKKVKQVKSGQGLEKMSPEEIDNVNKIALVDRRLKRGWKNATDFAGNTEQMKGFLDKISQKEKNKELKTKKKK